VVGPLAAEVAQAPGIVRQRADPWAGQAGRAVNVEHVVVGNARHPPAVRPACIAVGIVLAVGRGLSRVVVELAVDHLAAPVETGRCSASCGRCRTSGSSRCLRGAVAQVAGNQAQLVELRMGVAQVTRNLVPAGLVEVLAVGKRVAPE
jgi:hypothetical protein